MNSRFSPQNILSAQGWCDIVSDYLPDYQFSRNAVEMQPISTVNIFEFLNYMCIIIKYFCHMQKPFHNQH